jgi:bacteriocin-like protein
MNPTTEKEAMMNQNFTETTLNTQAQLLSADATGLVPELTDEELAQVYGGDGHMHGHRGTITLERGSSRGGRSGLSLRLHVYDKHYWNKWQRSAYKFHLGHGNHSGYDEDEDED